MLIQLNRMLATTTSNHLALSLPEQQTGFTPKYPKAFLLGVKVMNTLGKFPRIIETGKVSFISVLLLATGCAYNPDIRQSHDNTSGFTTRENADYVACVKDEVRGDTETFTEEENGKTRLFIGSTDPNKASGLVEFSSSQGENHFSVYQRNAWQDKGRLINTALVCSRA